VGVRPCRLIPLIRKQEEDRWRTAAARLGTRRDSAGTALTVFAVTLLLFVGSLLALQAGANVQLSGAVGNPIGASALQLTIGAGLLLALAAAAGTLGAFDELGTR
jgi:hypothetical protein